MTKDERMRVGAAIMWASMLLFGVPAVVLTWLNSRSKLPVVLPVIGACALVTITTTLAYSRRLARAKARHRRGG
jgi:hypothetical protein